MSKHIIDGTRMRNGSAKSFQYARIESTVRARPQSKVLQKQPHQLDPRTLSRRFFGFNRLKGSMRTSDTLD